MESVRKKLEDSVKSLREESPDVHGRLRTSFTARQRAMAYLAALGMDERDISQQLGISIRRVTPVFKSKTFQDEVSIIQEHLFFKNPQKMFMKILPKAMIRAYDIMMNPKSKDATVVDTAFKFMDRALGKPVQETKTEVAGLRELIDKLDEQKQVTGIPIIPADKVEDAQIIKPEEPKDEIDKFVEENF